MSSDPGAVLQQPPDAVIVPNDDTPTADEAGGSALSRPWTCGRTRSPLHNGIANRFDSAIPFRTS